MKRKLRKEKQFNIPEEYTKSIVLDDYGNSIDLSKEKMNRIAILAPSKGGKTHFLSQSLMNLLTSNNGKSFGSLGKDFYIFLVQPTFDNNRAYEAYPMLKKMLSSPKLAEVHREWNRRVANKLEFLIDRKKQGKFKKTLIVILDDVGDKSGTKKGEIAEVINEIANAGSQIPKFIFFGLFQKVTQMGTNMRTNFDAFYLFKFKTKQDLDQIRTNFFSTFTGMEFNRIYKKLYKKKYAMVEVLNLDGGVSVYRQDGKQLNY